MKVILLALLVSSTQVFAQKEEFKDPRDDRSIQFTGNGGELNFGGGITVEFGRGPRPQTPGVCMQAGQERRFYQANNGRHGTYFTPVNVRCEAAQILVPSCSIRDCDHGHDRGGGRDWRREDRDDNKELFVGNEKILTGNIHMLYSVMNNLVRAGACVEARRR